MEGRVDDPRNTVRRKGERRGADRRSGAMSPFGGQERRIVERRQGDRGVLADRREFP